MFYPTFGLYEQVKQSQLEMEQSAQLDLEIDTANQDSPSLLAHLGDMLVKLGSHLQQSSNVEQATSHPHS